MGAGLQRGVGIKLLDPWVLGRRLASGGWCGAGLGQGCRAGTEEGAVDRPVRT